MMKSEDKPDMESVPKQLVADTSVNSVQENEPGAKAEQEIDHAF